MILSTNLRDRGTWRSNGSASGCSTFLNRWSTSVLPACFASSCSRAAASPNREFTAASRTSRPLCTWALPRLTQGSKELGRVSFAWLHTNGGPWHLSMRAAIAAVCVAGKQSFEGRDPSRRHLPALKGVPFLHLGYLFVRARGRDAHCEDALDSHGACQLQEKVLVARRRLTVLAHLADDLLQHLASHVEFRVWV